MARTIDYKSLSADDLAYLADRTWLIAEGDNQGFETSKAVAHWRETGEAPETDGEGEGEGGEDDGIEYKDATVDQLKAELENRGLETTGKKADLVARLEANDAESADEDEEDDIPES